MKFKPIDILFAGFGILAICIFGFQIFLSSVRGLTPLELTLTSFLGVIFSVLATAYFAYTHPPPPNVSRNGQIQKMKLIGLKDIETSLKRGTTTLDALEEMKFEFEFLGIAGSKFIAEMFKDNKNICKVIAMLPKGAVRFLLLRPDCDLINTWISSPEKAKKIRDNIEESLKILSQQIKLKRKVRVRLYNYFPPMRLQIIDNQTAYVCEYDPIEDGWNSPQLIFNTSGERPFIKSLSILYEHLWNNADELDIKKYLD